MFGFEAFEIYLFTFASNTIHSNQVKIEMQIHQIEMHFRSHFSATY